MKRTLSWILTLAMVLSLFTTTAFADTWSPTISVSTDTSEIVVGGTTKVTATVTNTGADTTNFNYDITYNWTLGEGLTGSSSTNEITVTGASVGDSISVTCKATITPKLAEGGSGTPEAAKEITATAVNIKVVENNYEMRRYSSSEVKDTPEKLTVAVGKTVNVGYTGALWTTGDSAANESGASITYESSDTTVATISSKTVTGVAKGQANILAKTTYKGKEYSIIVATVTVNSLEASGNLSGASIVNGSSKTFSEGALYTAITNTVKTAAALDGSTTFSDVKIKAGAAANGITFYGSDGKTELGTSDYGDALTSGDTTNALTVKTTAGTIGTRTIEYTATENSNNTNNTTYTGTITFSSTYATVSATIAAPFTSEEFYLYPCSGATYISGSESIGTATSISVTPSRSSSTDTRTYYCQYYSGGTYGVKYKYTVTFTYPDYDLAATVEDGATPFNSDAIEEFAALVTDEQCISYGGYLDSVKITSVGSTSTYQLYSGSTKLTSGKQLTPAQLDALTMSVYKAGNYDISFTATYKYLTNKTATTYNGTNSVSGIIRVYAGTDGDIVYDVAYGETVSFDASDFAALYTSHSSTYKNGTLNYVTINSLPYVGTLYRSAKLTNATKVSVGDTYYVNPTGSQYGLNDLIYWALSTFTEEYSVYLPVTLSGTRGSIDAIVELHITGGVPFTDIAKGSTFYEYISYAYNKGIMGGKSSTNFDATSSISRIQLVTTLYRMAGSPTTYNNRVLSYTDTAGMRSEYLYALKWASAKGIVSGYGSSFNPYTAVTRQAMVTILYRYAQSNGFDTSVIYNNHLGDYADGGSVSGSMSTAMNWAIDNGLVSGNGSKLNPGGSTTRGAAAKILSVFHQTYIG